METITEVIEVEEVEVGKITTQGRITIGEEIRKLSVRFCAAKNPKDPKLLKTTNPEETIKREEVIIKKEAATSSLKPTVEEMRERITIPTSNTSL